MRDNMFRHPKIDDLDKINLHPVYSHGGNYKEVAEQYLRLPLNIAYTILDPLGEPLAIAGGLFIYNKVMEIWTIVDKRVFDMPLYYAKAMKSLLDSCFKNFDVNRLQVVIRADQPWALHWGKFLGFTKEGILRKYGQEGVDYIMFAKVRD